jgi:23S rRNA (uracil1939-C5)-methyltransferase
MDLKKNDNIILELETLTSDGAALGHYEGIAVFVRGAVPGDTVEAHIIKAAKRYCIGKLIKVISPSPERIESDCPAFPQCGGCSFRFASYNAELEYKKQRVEDAVKRIAHLDIPVRDVIFADKTERYRNKAQYPVKIENGVLSAGFYAYKSHRIIPCDNCRLQNEAFSECLKAFADWVREAHITSYDEKTGKGLLRHIYLRRGEASGEIMACAIINADTLPEPELLSEKLGKIEGMTSICFNVNKADSNVILGEKTYTLWGNGTIRDELLGKSFNISPASFYQVNHDQCEKLYSKAAEYARLTGEETLVDLYCGAGTVGLTMADKAKRLFGIEIVPQAIENAKANAALNGITNAEFFCGDALDGAKELEKRGIKADVVVLDPPRKGCDSELFDVIARMSPERIVYISCDSATLARDLAILDEKGYAPQEITPVDMFPRTPHVETVVQLSRSDMNS